MRVVNIGIGLYIGYRLIKDGSRLMCCDIYELAELALGGDFPKRLRTFSEEMYHVEKELRAIEPPVTEYMVHQMYLKTAMKNLVSKEIKEIARDISKQHETPLEQRVRRVIRILDDERHVPHSQVEYLVKEYDWMLKKVRVWEKSNPPLSTEEIQKIHIKNVAKHLQYLDNIAEAKRIEEFEGATLDEKFFATIEAARYDFLTKHYIEKYVDLYNWSLKKDQ